MKTICPTCNTLYDDAGITPGMIICCAKCGQNFQAFPAVELKPPQAVVQADSNSAAEDRENYVYQTIICTFINYAAKTLTFFYAFFARRLLFLFLLKPGTSVTITLLMITAIIALAIIHEKKTGGYPELKWPFLLGIALSLMEFLGIIFILQHKIS